MRAVAPKRLGRTIPFTGRVFRVESDRVGLSNGRTVTLDPVATLSSLTQFTARVVGGTAGIKDLAGNPLAADRVWSFTTRQ